MKYGIYIYYKIKLCFLGFLKISKFSKVVCIVCSILYNELLFLISYSDSMYMGTYCNVTQPSAWRSAERWCPIGGHHLQCETALRACRKIDIDINIKIPKIPKVTKYELWNLYILLNKNLMLLVFSKFSNISKVFCIVCSILYNKLLF